MGVCFLGTAGCTTPPAPDATSSSPSAESPMMPTPDPAVQTNQPQGQQLPISARAELGGQEILLEVAETPEQQAMGLMYRPALPDDRGMLFPMSRPRPVSFWMMNVPVPLDMVFVYQGRIRGIAASAPPCTAAPCPTYGPGNQLIDHVIELRGGRAAELGLAVGDPVTINRLAEPINP
ncbi:MAG: DUF192 domain-containing protein [Cyanobacteria bacterium Co-bin13]|nr:DUF192 domain-containing protein [Cyanobacteria bacterium Co-bin13]